MSLQLQQRKLAVSNWSATRDRTLDREERGDDKPLKQETKRTILLSSKDEAATIPSAAAHGKSPPKITWATS